jgi:hypothetical protein
MWGRQTRRVCWIAAIFLVGVGGAFGLQKDPPPVGAVECEHVEGDDLDSLVGTEDLRQSGALDLSVEKVESVARAMLPAVTPLKLMFGAALLFHARAFAHLILFTHAFNISGGPGLKQVAVKIKGRYLKILNHVDRSSVSFLRVILVVLHPDQVVAAIGAVHYGLMTCLASVVSPLAGAAGVGLSLGRSVDRHVQPVLRRYVASPERLAELPSCRLRAWANLATVHMAELAGVFTAVNAIGLVNLASGCLLGATLVVDVVLLHVEKQLKRFSARSNHVLLQKVASNFDPKLVASSGGFTYAIALLGFLTQIRNSKCGMSFLSKTVLCGPVAAEAMLAGLKWTLLARR